VALLSIVVPAYNVQAYLADCLDSLLHQRFSDIEVVAVNDRSPDRSGAILDEYSAADPRVRVLHLPENVGLGQARNAGLAAATGEYVWFVDSDDWVAGDALPAIAERLKADGPDVLMLGHASAFWDGHTELSEYHGALTAAPVAPFRATAYPAIFRVFPVAWNKVVRRDLLRSLDLGFPTGYYEDLPFTYPLLAAADTIAVLDQICVYYRQRRGSILRSGGRQHLELIDQYRLVFDRLAALGERAGPLVPVVYRIMAKHLFVIIGSGRLGKQIRREYFAGATALARSLRPADFRPPGGADGIRYRMLVSGSWPAVVLLRTAYQVAQGVRRGARTVAGRLGRGVRSVGRLARKAVLRGYYRIQTHRPLDEHLALYCANWGRGYVCNPRAVYEKARELAPAVRGVWAVTAGAAADMPPGVEYVVLESAAFYRALARAKFLVNNNNFGNYLRKRRGSVFLQTHHGTPLKTMGINERPGGAARTAELRSLLRRCDNWDFDLSSNVYSTNIWQRAYPSRFRTLEFGYPRNDMLVEPDPARAAAVRERLGLAADDRVILYAPTHREYHTGYQSFFDPADFVRALGPGNRLLVRAHYFYGGATASASSRVLDVSTYPVVEELYLAADVLITDYSSVMFDYAVLDRPIVIYAPDWYAYRLTRGVYFDLAAEPPGLFTPDYDALVAAFRTGDFDTDTTRAHRADFRRRFCPFDDGHAAERAVRAVLLGEAVTPPA
jgi:CDP-glycerol glycerophosphotransferase